MKFTTSKILGGALRRGQLQLEQCLVQTPALMLYTKGASIPHITKEVLEMITNNNHILEIPLLSTVHMRTTLESFGKQINHLSGLNDYPTFFLFHDPIVEVPTNQLEKYNMPLWARTGKVALDANEFMNIVETFKPAMYASLSDNFTNKDSAKKRVLKSVARSEDMFKDCLDRHKASTYLRENSNILGVIVGGYNLDQRQNSLNVLLNSSDDLSGFVLDGFDTNFPNLKNHSFEDKKEIVEKITIQLPEDKLRIVPGCWNAPMLLEFVSAGWDIFDTSAVCQTTDKNCAFVFKYKVSHGETNGFIVDEDVESSYEIDLGEDRYKEDFTSLVTNCECLTCSEHTRAYIYHLINTRELLAGVLLTIHNIHHYLKFFEAIRECETNEQLNKLKLLIGNQYKQHTELLKMTPKPKSPPSPNTKRKRLSPERRKSE